MIVLATEVSRRDYAALDLHQFTVLTGQQRHPALTITKHVADLKPFLRLTSYDLDCGLEVQLFPW
jgi:hypothetical protein